VSKPFAWVLAVAASVLALVTVAAAESLPMRGTVDPRIRTALYKPDEVYRLYGFVGYHLDLEFAADESFVGLSAGDPEALTYSAHDNILTLRPKAALVQMNLTVSTSKRRYYFEYSAAVRRPNRVVDEEVIYAVRFSYPLAPGPKDALTPAERVEFELARARESRPRNIDYWFCGSRAIKPIAASDDGVHTRLTFGTRGELPGIFVRNDDGSESLLNFSVDGGDVVIHRVAAKFIVRRGKLTGCVVNKGFVGGGERLESGTIAPAVTRERKDASP
jgi:type IV secretion system protein VirB9